MTEAEGYLQVVDVEEAETMVAYLMEQGHVVSELRKNKSGLEEYYMILMAQKEAQ